MTALIRMELLKLVKRPMTWVLAILLHGGVGFAIVVSFFELGSAEAEVRERILQSVTLPGVIPWTAELIAIFGAIMLSILAASAIGSEYGWGTLRPFLATGMPRSRFLAAKLVALAAVGLAFTTLPLLMSAILAVPIARLNDRPIVAGTVDLAWLLDLAAIVGRTFLAVLVPMTIAFLVGLAGRSQAAGIGTALGLLIGEQIVAGLLLLLGRDWAEEVVNLLPLYNSQALIGYYNSFGTPEIPDGLIGEWRAVATLLGYCLVCLALAFTIFRRRDIRGTA